LAAHNRASDSSKDLAQADLSSLKGGRMNETALRDFIKQHIDGHEIGYTGTEGISDLVNFFVNAVGDSFTLAIQICHKWGGIAEQMSPGEQKEFNRLMVESEKEFQEKLFCLLSGGADSYSLN
jgi:hypothetical protein